MVQNNISFPRPLAFITGASSGIGAAAVQVFAKAGFDVILATRRVERLDKVAENARLSKVGGGEHF
jgi:NADP-dependent 3-hydroxy acid dehydrogenase YdfG